MENQTKIIILLLTNQLLAFVLVIGLYFLAVWFDDDNA